MKYCTHCGAELLDEAVLCPKCGCWVNNDGNKPNEVTRPKLSSLALAGFILSVVSIVFAIFFLAITDTESSLSSLVLLAMPTGIAGLVCSSIGVVKIKRKKLRGKGLAVAGTVIGAIVCAFWLIMIILGVYVVIGFYILLLLALLTTAA